MLRLACAIALTLGFQNCAPPSPAEPPVAVNLSSSGGSGNGYDGKAYVLPRRENLCPDGSVVEARIDFQGNRPILVRENCADLPPEQQREVAVTLDPADPSFIVYDGGVYVAVLSQIAEFRRDAAGHVLVGGTFVPGASPADPKRNFAAKLDADDRLLWARELSVGAAAEITTATLGPGGAPVYAGFARDESGPPYLFVTRLSANGDLLWSRRYDFNEAGVNETRAWDIQQDALGHLYVGGSFNGARLGGFIVKLAADGALLWQLETKAYQNLGFAPDGTLIGQGLCSGLPEHCVIKLGTDGGLRWSKKVGIFASAMRPLSDGSIVVAGSTSLWGPALITKLDGNGSLLWTRTLAGPPTAGKPDSAGSLQSLEERPDGSLLVAGLRMITFSQFRGVVYSLTADGQAQWMLTHPNPFYGNLDLDGDELRVHGYTYPISGSAKGLSFILRLPDPPPDAETNAVSTAVTTGFAAGPAPATAALLRASPLNVESRDFRIKLDVRR